MTKDQPFRIVTYFPETTASWVVSDDEFSFTSPGPALIGTNFFVAEEQLSMAGWSLQDLTGFFANQSIQRPNTYTASGLINTGVIPPTGATGGISASDVVIISDVPLTIDTNIQSAGFMAHDSDYMSIKFAQGILVTQNLNAPIQMTITDSWSYGSGEPTASEMLFCYRIFYIQKTDKLEGDSITFPEVRYVAQGIAAEEPDYVYINRLRRSYELKQL